jgi:5-methylcytosine-specific restriction endonuclease McrA
MTRRDFSRRVKREALARSGGLCEAVGVWYGLEPNQRCRYPLNIGVQFDHVTADALGGEPTLENCAATCPRCHIIKSSNIDTPKAAKTKRQSDKHLGIRSTSRPIDGSKNSLWRKPFRGPAERRHP